MHNGIIKVTSSDFKDIVLKSTLPVFSCFVASRCGSCFALNLIIGDLITHYKDLITFVEIDAEKSLDIMEKYHLKFLPSVLIFVNGNPVKNLPGFRYKEELKSILDGLLMEK